MTSLESFGREFANELQGLVRQTLGTSRAVRSVKHRGRTVVRPGSSKPVAVALKYKGRLSAKLMFRYEIGLDSSGKFPAITTSEVHLLSAATNRPVLRYEYLSNANRSPSAHWHVHGENTELGRILGDRGPVRGRLEDLHLPVGGIRFRPALEDVIEFLIVDLEFDHERAWRSAVNDGRERWRATQLAVAVRDSPEHAAETLRRLGYAVTAGSGANRNGNLRRLAAF